MKDDLQFDDSDQDPIEQTSLPFNEASDDTPSAPARTADETASVAARCGSCGAPIGSGSLCAGCEQAFHQVLDTTEAEKNQHTIPASQFDELFAALEEAQVRAKEPSAAPKVEEAPQPFVVPQVAVAAETFDAPQTFDSPQPFVVREPVVPQPEIAMPKFDTIASQPAFVAPEPKPIALKQERVTTAPVPVDSKPEVVPPESAPAAKASEPLSVAAPRETSASAQPKPATSAAMKRTFAAAAAIVVLGAIGAPLTRLWLGRQQQVISATPAAAPKLAAAPKPAPPARPEATAAAVTKPSTARHEAPATIAATARPVAVATPRPSIAPENPDVAAANRAVRPPAKAVRPSKPSPQVAALATPAPVVESATTILPAAATEVVAVAAPAPVAPEAPVGPFYESTQVDRTPQVLSRVEPQLSPELQSRANGEIVVVRFLVTQTGHPVLVSLLRRSKSGLPLEEAVIAAIKKWTFAPATKRGQAVSCFVHLGVPIGR